MLAVDERPQFFLMWTSPKGCLNAHHTAAGFLLSKGSEREHRASCHVFQDLVSEVALSFPQDAVSSWVSPFTEGGDYQGT